MQPRPLKIVVVEDDRDTRQTVVRLLERRGYSICAASNARDAYRLIVSDPPDLLICDLGLPDRDGRELMKEISDSHPHLTAIAITGYGNQADVNSALAAGFASHLTKPITVEDLEEAIATWS